MSTFRYWSRSLQRVSADEADGAALALLDALTASAVLTRVEIALTPGDPFVAFDVLANVQANQSDRLSTLCAFASADEAWRGALADVGLEPNCMRSEMVI